MNNTCAAASSQSAIASHATITVDRLAWLTFVANADASRKFQLDLPGLDKSKDLFFFLLNLLCKGLVMQAGDGRRVWLEDITASQLDVIGRCMSAIGVSLIATPVPDVDVSSPSHRRVDMSHVHALPENLPLEDYHVSITLRTPDASFMPYRISFRLL